jgi:hypothetical protein
MIRRLAIVAALLLPAAAPRAPAVNAEGALRLLLGASATPIPAASSCHAVVPGVSRPTLGDLLATPLAGLDGGANRVTGGCEDGRCHVKITHRGEEEDVFAAEYRFSARGGRLVRASLSCFSTP